MRSAHRWCANYPRWQFRTSCRLRGFVEWCGYPNRRGRTLQSAARARPSRTPSPLCGTRSRIHRGRSPRAPCNANRLITAYPGPNLPAHSRRLSPLRPLRLRAGATPAPSAPLGQRVRQDPRRSLARRLAEAARSHSGAENQTQRSHRRHRRGLRLLHPPLCGFARHAAKVYAADIPAASVDTIAALKPGGRIVIIDFYKRELSVGPPVSMKLSEDQVRAELTAASFRQTASHTFLSHQYFLEFKR